MLPGLAAESFDPASLDAAAVAWVLAASGAALLTGPGVALFYGGMVRAGHVLGVLQQYLTAAALVTLTWVLAGYTLAFGAGNGLAGDLQFAGLSSMSLPVPGFTGTAAQSIPPLLFAGFQLMFALLAATLIIGATADRWRFASFALFIPLWTLSVYAPIAHWLSSPSGWAARWGAMDFAGGMSVQVTAGASALAMVLVLGPRQGWPDLPMRPHNVPLSVAGAALAWFGWLGLVAGSALRADQVAVTAFVNTLVAGAAGLVAWCATEQIRCGQVTALGAVSGLLSGLVAITTGAGCIAPLSALLTGFVAGLACAGAVTLTSWFGVDDALDVAGVHLTGGIVGTLCLGLFASTETDPHGVDGLFYGGGYHVLAHQSCALVAVGAYAFAVTYILGKVLDRVVGNRVSPRQEALGDLALHGEPAYDLAGADDAHL